MSYILQFYKQSNFGFTKSVTLPEKLSKLEISNFLLEDDVREIPCLYCDCKFINQQGLIVHLKCVNLKLVLVPASDYLQRLLQEPVIKSVLKPLLKRTIYIMMPKVEKPEVEIISVQPTKRESLRGRNHNK